MMKTWAPFKKHKQRWDCVKVNGSKLSLFFQQTSVCGTCGQRHSGSDYASQINLQLSLLFSLLVPNVRHKNTNALERFVFK